MQDPIDFAEVFVLLNLDGLNSKICAIYSPGLDIVIRIEDLMCLKIEYGHEKERAFYIEKYCAAFKTLIEDLGVGGFVAGLRESDMMVSADYDAKVEGFIGVFHDYLLAHPYYKQLTMTAEQREEDFKLEELTIEAAEAALGKSGWLGGIDAELIKFLDDRYRLLYPDLFISDRIIANAKYFACVLARKFLNGTGHRAEWNFGRIDLSFNPQMPGSMVFAPRIHYRAMPAKLVISNQPFWKLRTFGVRRRRKSSASEQLARLGIVVQNNTIDDVKRSYELKRLGSSVIALWMEQK